MMKKLLLILLCLPMIGFGQVYIPDANFKAYLVGNSAINTNGDGDIQVSEASSFNGDIICDSMNIFDLTGIEAFNALTTLSCSWNNLTSLDVTQNTVLTSLDCSENQLTSPDVSNNTALTHLLCSFNQITSLDVSNNTELIHLACAQNQLTSLDVSTNLALLYLACFGNQLTSLDVSNNTALFWLLAMSNQLTSLDVRNGNNTSFNSFSFSAKGNSNLSCIDVDYVAWSNANWTVASNNIDLQHYFSSNCPPTLIQEHTTNKELLKATDLLGRETKGTKNKPLLYIYDDGTVEKRIIIE